MPYRTALPFFVVSHVVWAYLRDVRAPSSVNDGRDGAASPTNNCTKCCDGSGAPFEVTVDPEPAHARLRGRNLTWVRLPRANISVGSGRSVTLTTAGEKVTGLRYAWTDFVDCVLDNRNSSGIPAGPFRHWF